MTGITCAIAGMGGSTFTPVTRTYTSGSGTETIPTGASQVVIEVWGGGGAGGRGSTLCIGFYGGGGNFNPQGNGGAGAAGTVKFSYT